MDGQFQVERGSCTAKQGGYEAIPAREPNRPGQVWKFVDEFQQLLGDDSEADSQFFVETWTFGMAAAVENYQKRRKKQAGREAQNDTFRELDDLVTLSSAEESDGYAEFPSPAETATFAGQWDDDRPWQSTTGPAMQQEEQRVHEAETLDEELDGCQEIARPMTLSLACELLGVNEGSSRQQVKAAYRREVSKWHPDRLGGKSLEVRQRATAHMAAINEAYRLLRSELGGKSV